MVATQGQGTPPLSILRCLSFCPPMQANTTTSKSPTAHDLHMAFESGGAMIWWCCCSIYGEREGNGPIEGRAGWPIFWCVVCGVCVCFFLLWLYWWGLFYDEKAGNCKDFCFFPKLVNKINLRPLTRIWRQFQWEDANFLVLIQTYVQRGSPFWFTFPCDASKLWVCVGPHCTAHWWCDVPLNR